MLNSSLYLGNQSLSNKIGAFSLPNQRSRKSRHGEHRAGLQGRRFCLEAVADT
ncbi:hypothetical protein HMPREF9439_01277 [Parasutterella excrementihominis YIT 11859]|uniref:Uncharacterized protein n=1 Tax=Parasutterella excrementihominis YIT 11859 TaxID=762966 RepID=F3QK20_9BURK|nr:hypothetical protein HMPREF9439_01277 [Parasutterella excrementihominis YIT 11859]